MSYSNTITKNDLKNIIEQVSAIDGTDMTQAEIEAFVEGLDVSGINAVDYIVEQGSNVYGTYRKWNSGVLEQWGQIITSASSGTVSSNIQFPISFIDTSYIVMLTPRRNFGASMSVSESNSAGNTQRTTNTTYVTWWKSGNAYATEIQFYVKGTWK